MTNPAAADLIARSNRLGADPKNTNYAGGNTSAKGTEIDPVTGEPVELLWVKGSGALGAKFTLIGRAYLRRKPDLPGSATGVPNFADPQGCERAFREGARPPLTEMIRFINEYRDRFGVELICRVLRPAVQGFLTARGYRAAIGRAPSARQLKDELLVPEVARLHAENYGVYGRRKMHALMRRQRWEIGRDQTERLMRLAGVRGVRKSTRVFTTHSDKTTVLPSDLVNRRFTAPAPRRLGVCDVTYVATWSGSAYVAFVTDVYSRRIVGWNVASTLRSEILPLQALDMAAWNAGGRLNGLIHHTDHGSNYTAMVYTDRIVELGAVPSTGTVGDSFDNAMAEAVNNLYKTELIRQRGPWRTVEQVELATLGWVWCMRK